jgi:hypothetical protein
MLLRRFTDFILRSRLQAMGTAFVFAFLPLISSVSIIIAAFVTLRKGTFEGALVLFAAVLPTIFGFAFLPAEEHFSLMMGALDVVLLSNLLTWVFATQLAKYKNWTFVLECSTLLGILVVIAVHLIYPDVQSWWSAHLSEYFAQSIHKMGQYEPGEVGAQTMVIDKMVASVKMYATGLVVSFILFNALLQVVLARWWQAVMFNPQGLRGELYQIRLGQTAGIIFVIGLVLSYWGYSIVLDIMPVLYLAFGIAGLSLLHSVIALSKVKWLWLTMVYLGVMLFPLSITLIAMLALIDTGVDFRKRLGKQS